MGIFSKLFGKKKEVQNEVTSVNVNNAPKKEIVSTAIERPFGGQIELPPYQGDYAKTIFLYANSKAAPVKPHDSYVRYLMYECGIRDSSNFHRIMIAEGYYAEASVEVGLDLKTVAELKQILTDLGQPVTGKKSILIERITNNTDKTTLKKYIPEKLFVLSKKGQDFVEQHYDYVLLHKHKEWGVDWHEYDVNHKSGISFYDTMWGIFNRRIMQNSGNGARNTYLNMHQLCEVEGKRDRALELLLRVIYMDFGGDGIRSEYDLYRRGIYKKESIIDHFASVITIAPGLIKEVIKYHDIYSDDYVDRIYTNNAPFRVCDKVLFKKTMHSILDGTYNEAYVTEQLKKAYIKVVSQF